MIHYALPRSPEGVPAAEAFRYGDCAILCLIEELQALTGEPADRFAAKIVGGARDPKGVQAGVAAGPGNVEVARSLLLRHRIPIVGEDVGGSSGRRVIFYPDTGRLQVAFLRPDENSTGATRSGPARVLIVDDSKVIRDLLRRVLQEDRELVVVGEAADPIEAQARLRETKPDVITLDVHMPKMTGVEWLERLMPTTPLPVVMISSLQMQDGNEVFRALELGAIDYIQKPSLAELPTAGQLIREKVKAAARAKVIRPTRPLGRAASADMDFETLLAIGASTGGTEALKSVLCALPDRIPPTLIVQHIPPVFSRAFAERINALCAFEVKEAEDGDEVRASRALIAPGGKQMRLQRGSGGWRVRITDDAPVNRHKPSVDYLFHSVAELVGAKAVGVILTGMGGDGAKGLLEMKKRGARTLAQDEQSCVVYGMPRAAYEIGAVERVASLEAMPKEILAALARKKAA